MIPRYSRPEKTTIWEPQTRFQIWFEIEAHAADALAEIGTIPKEAAKRVWEKAKGVIFNVDRIDEIERETKLTPVIGRSHGIHAEPVTFGLKLAYAYAEFDRNRARLVAARKEIATCA